MRFYKLCGRLVKCAEEIDGNENKRFAEEHAETADGGVFFGGEREESDHGGAPVFFGEEDGKSKDAGVKPTDISARTEDFNGRSPDSYYALAEIKGEEATFCLISRESGDPLGAAASFASHVGVEVGELEAVEITLSAAAELLCSASRRNFIDDDDRVLEKFGLERMSHGRCGSLSFGENVTAEKAEKATLISSAKEFRMTETLLPEIKRIYSGRKRTRVTGHPVHYVIETNDRDARRDIYKTLLDALYANNRVGMRRYTFVDIELDDDCPAEALTSLYKLSEDGAVVMRCTVDKTAARSDAYSAIENICNAIREYRSKTLTILCFPRGCEEIKERIYRRLNGISFVEVREDLISGDGIKRFLTGLARERRIKPDVALYKAADTTKKYYACELNTLFEDWYGGKLRNSVYSQYKNAENVRCGALRTESMGSAYDELSALIGLTEAKRVIKRAVDYFKMQRLYEERGIKNEQPAMHMCFMGNPGTAKTTVARLFAEIMRENGLLVSGHLVETGRNDLVGRYTGWTAQQVVEKFKDAKGGVLFIDEAYSLVDDKENSFGDEAINAIVREMENNREDTVVIFAGYKDKMKEFMERNPGMRSRIPFHVSFEDYGVDELCDIARHIIGRNGMNITEGALAKLRIAFAAAKNDVGFGNGRFVRNMLEEAKMNQASRLLSGGAELITDYDIRTITEEDVIIPEVRRETDVRIGFVA